MTTSAVISPLRRFNWRAVIVPSALFALVLLVLGGRLIGSLSNGADAADVLAAAQQGAAKGAAPATTAPPTPTTTPGYDYLSCTHVAPDDQNVCSPILVWPLTEGAKTLIGYQKGGIPGELNTANTRIVYDQIRNKLAAVDACQMWLGIERDTSMNGVLTVYPSQTKAPAGSVALVDCAPKGGTTQGSIPTAGQS